MKEKES